VKLIRPMLATLSTEIPTGPSRVFEEKYDGIRALAYRTKKKVRLWSRNQLELTAGFPEVADSVAALPGGDLVLDGELVVFDNKGVSRFQLLQRRGSGARAAYAVFDLLERDGKSMLKRPLNERRAALEDLIGDDGRVLPRAHLGALLVGLYDGPALRYTGKVGSGYTRESLVELATLVAPLRVKTSPFADAPPMKNATWVQPKLVAQVTFAEWTAAGKLRQPVFLGSRRDKAPRECRWDERER